jgi:NAD(P)H-dependent FMN reductase
VLKNALDTVYAEWAGKPAGIVAYGAGGGKKSAAQLRAVLEHMKFGAIADDVNVAQPWAAITEDGIQADMVSGDIEALIDQVSAE